MWCLAPVCCYRLKSPLSTWVQVIFMAAAIGSASSMPQKPISSPNAMTMTMVISGLRSMDFLKTSGLIIYPSRKYIHGKRCHGFKNYGKGLVFEPGKEHGRKDGNDYANEGQGRGRPNEYTAEDRMRHLQPVERCRGHAGHYQ